MSSKKEDLGQASDGQLNQFGYEINGSQGLNSQQDRFEMSPTGLSDDVLDYLDRLIDKKMDAKFKRIDRRGIKPTTV